MENYLEIIEFNDPLCTWCYGSEPILTKLLYRFPEQIKLSFVMGGLVRDIREWYDSRNPDADPIEANNKNLPLSWLESSKRHGMPVITEGFKLFSNEYPSSFPQNIAVKAAQFEGDEIAAKFLRRLRFATILEGKVTSRLDVLIEIASEVGLNLSSFISHIEDGSAERAFEEDRYAVQQYQIKGFPAFMVKYKDKQVLMRSFQTYEDFLAVFKMLGADLKEKDVVATSDNVLEFIEQFELVAPVEIKSTFNLTNKELKDLLDKMKTEQLIRRQQLGNGELISSNHASLECDPLSGFCSF